MTEKVVLAQFFRGLSILKVENRSSGLHVPYICVRLGPKKLAGNQRASI